MGGIISQNIKSNNYPQSKAPRSGDDATCIEVVKSYFVPGGVHMMVDAAGCSGFGVFVVCQIVWCFFCIMMDVVVLVRVCGVGGWLLFFGCCVVALFCSLFFFSPSMHLS